MQPTIRLLSDETINQIAAGEVIESPASVVKELVENALDANATRVIVEVVGGGMQKIRITDDGVGMHKEDAKMAIVRHATSKISQAQDLFRIASKGFRGEALASIASISKMTIETALDNEIGTKLEIERGEIVKEGKCARTQGTTFEVRSLFHNVPARKRFQKSSAAQSAEIFRLMTQMALSHPDVQFELISNGKKTLSSLQNEGLIKRAESLLGNEFCKGAFSVEFEEGPLRFFGLVGAPHQSRPNRMSQYLFLNKRAVQCEAISDAIRKGYGTRLEEKRHPLFLLHLDVPADLIDVNVHPQKLQVRLRKEELFREKVCEAIEQAFSSKREEAKPIFKPIEVNYEEPSFIFREEAVQEETELALPSDPVEIMGQSGPYLFIKKEEAILVIDIERAFFRITFEDLLSKINTKAEKQGLLVPFTFDLTPVESAMVLTHKAAIEEMGFSLKAIGKENFMVDALPPFLDESEVKSVVAQMAHALQEFIGKIDYEKARREKLALSLSQHARVKKHYSLEEAKRLFERLQNCDNPMHCPKGSPTQVELDHDTIEHLFRENQKAPTKAR